MKSKKARRPKDDRAAVNPTTIQERAPESKQQPMKGRDSGSSLSTVSKNQKLVFEAEILGNDRFETTGTEKDDDGFKKMFH